MNCIHRCCPGLLKGAQTGYNKEIADTLKNNIIINIQDFTKTFKDGFKPSNVRNNASNQRKSNFNPQDIINNFDQNTNKILNELIERLDIYINRCKNGGISFHSKQLIMTLMMKMKMKTKIYIFDQQNNSDYFQGFIMTEY